MNNPESIKTSEIVISQLCRTSEEESIYFTHSSKIINGGSQIKCQIQETSEESSESKNDQNLNVPVKGKL